MQEGNPGTPLFSGLEERQVRTSFGTRVLWRESDDAGKQGVLGNTSHRQLGVGPCRERGGEEPAWGLRLCYFSSGSQSEGTDPEDPRLEKLGHRVLKVLKTPTSSILCTVCCELLPLPLASSPKSPSLSGPFPPPRPPSPLLTRPTAAWTRQIPSRPQTRQ